MITETETLNTRDLIAHEVRKEIRKATDVAVAVASANDIYYVPITKQAATFLLVAHGNVTPGFALVTRYEGDKATLYIDREV